PAAVQPAEAERPEPVRVADADDPALVHEDEGEGAPETGDDGGDRPLERDAAAAAGPVAVPGPAVDRVHVGDGGVTLAQGGELGRDELGDEVAVARHRAGEHPRLAGQLLDVDEVAV